MSDTALYYRRSGRFGAIAAMGTLTAGAITAAVLGSVYGVLVFYSPIVYLNLIGTLALGFAVGWVVGTCAKAFHVRHAGVALLLGLLCGLVAENFQFAGWVLALSQWNVLLLDPTQLAPLLIEVADKGVWGLGRSGGTVSGLTLYAVWLTEAAIIIGAAAIVPAHMINKSHYCEPCRRWLDESRSLLPYAPIHDVAGMRRKLEQGEFAALGELQPVGDDAASYSKILLRSCTLCDQLHLMSMVNVTVAIDKKGNVTTTEKPIVTDLLIDRATRDLMEQILPSMNSDGDGTDTGEQVSAATDGQADVTLEVDPEPVQRSPAESAGKAAT